MTSTAVTGTDKETEYTLKDYIGENPGDTAQELRDNLVQPVVVGSGSKIKKMSKKSVAIFLPTSKSYFGRVILKQYQICMVGRKKMLKNLLNGLELR